MFADLNEFYEAVEQLRQRLAGDGEERRASELGDALVGTTAGEVLSELRGALGRLNRSGLPRRLGIEQTVGDMILFTDAALGPSLLRRPASVIAPVRVRLARWRERNRA